MLESMAKVGLDEAPVVAVDGLRSNLRTLREGSVQPELLVIRKKLSRSPSEYRHRVAQALASQFIEREGGTVMPGMEISFIMTEDGPQPSDLVSSAPDLGFYETALIRAGHSILEPFGFTEEEVESKAHGQSGLSSFLMPRRSQC
jgi:DNA polymerase elongation subunit (family B)